MSSLGGTPTPKVQGLEGKAPQVTCGLVTQGWGFAPIDVWPKTREHFGHVMDGDDRGWRGESNATKIVKIQVAEDEILIFEVNNEFLGVQVM